MNKETFWTLFLIFSLVVGGIFEIIFLVLFTSLCFSAIKVGEIGLAFGYIFAIVGILIITGLYITAIKINKKGAK